MSIGFLDSVNVLNQPSDQKGNDAKTDIKGDLTSQNHRITESTWLEKTFKAIQPNHSPALPRLQLNHVTEGRELA